VSVARGRRGQLVIRGRKGLARSWRQVAELVLQDMAGAPWKTVVAFDRKYRLRVIRQYYTLSKAAKAAKSGTEGPRPRRSEPTTRCGGWLQDAHEALLVARAYVPIGLSMGLFVPGDRGAMWHIRGHIPASV
jgi:hypothetical protein